MDCVVRTDDKKILELLIPYHASNKNIFFKESGDFFYRFGKQLEYIWKNLAKYS